VLCEIINGVPIIKRQEEIEQFKWIKLEDFFNNFSDDKI
jgi:hypothetical protein